MNVSRQIGWSNESNLLYQILKQITKLTAVIFSLKPKYKVYTALLTQSGGDNPTSIINQPLIIGTTYSISEADIPNVLGDFTNVGAPNNEIGTYFIATGTTPNSWGTNISLSYNTGAPTAIVLENTIGNIWFTYINTGIYSVNSNNLFIEDKTTIDIDTFGANATNLENTPFYIGNETIINAETQFQIFTTRPPDYRDNVLQKNRLEIRVYN